MSEQEKQMDIHLPVIELEDYVSIVHYLYYAVFMLFRTTFEAVRKANKFFDDEEPWKNVSFPSFKFVMR